MKKHIGLKTGIVFSIISLLCAFTLFIPVYTVFPALFLEQFITDTFGTTYQNGSKITLLILVLLFIVALYITMRIIKNRAAKGSAISIKETTVVMLVLWLIVHSLGYYLLLWYEGFPLDALNAMMSVASFPFTSLSFATIGLLMDSYWKATNIMC